MLLYVFAILVLLGLVWYTHQRIKTRNYPPGPFCLPLIGSLPWLSSFNPPDNSTMLLEQYNSDWVYFKFLNMEFFSTKNPEICKMLFRKPKLFDVPQSSIELFESFIPHNILTAKGEKWARLRSAVKDKFTPAATKGFRQMIERAVDDRIASFEGCDTIDMNQESRRLTLNVIYNILFSTAFDDDETNQEIKKLINYFVTKLDDYVFQLPFIRKLNTPLNKKFRQNIQKFRQIMIHKIEARRQQLESSPAPNSDEKPRDVLDHLLLSQDLSDDEIINNVLFLVLAGHDTTTTSLAMGFWNMNGMTSEHNKIRSNEDISDVVREVLRLGGVTQGALRETTKDMVLDGYTIPKGGLIHVSNKFTTYNPEIFPEPYEFNSDRPKNPNSHYYITFGGGRKICLGQYLARLEITIFLKKFFAKYDYRCVQEPVIVKGLINRPMSVNIRLIKRSIDRKID